MNILAEHTVRIGRGYVGTLELRPNRGPEVDMFQIEGGGWTLEDLERMEAEGKAPPYCAPFVSFCVERAKIVLRAEGWVGPWQFARGASLLKLKDRNPNLIIPAFEPGCIGLDFHSKAKGHCWIGVEMLSDGVHIRTIEGNTGPGPRAPRLDRDGQGVFERFDRRLEDADVWMRIG